jgi:hypothetical protein
MQLRNIVLAFLGILVSVSSSAQEDSTKVKLDDIEISFLGSYYEQDGNHSPVTGGIGTEQLTNIAPTFSINIPIDTVRTITFDGAVDFYSSASSDNINNPFLDPGHVSSASAHDSRIYGTLGYKRKNNQKNTTKGIFVGASAEYDVSSVSGGVSFSKSSKDHNKDISLKASYFFDNWSLIYPVEFRNGSEQYLTTDLRHSFNFSATGSVVINKRMSASLTTDAVVQRGMLSTPFHRVYFSDAANAKIEQLPGQRFKMPIGLRFNYHLTDFLILKTFYRFYFDNWGLTAHTLKAELPIKLGNTFRLYPFYRFHVQSAADYFSPHGEASVLDTYFTSDYDLSGLTSNKVGVGLSIAPLYGLLRYKRIFKKDKLGILKSIDFRYANYSRSDGFKANTYSIALKMNIGQ